MIHDEESNGLLNEEQANQLFGCILNTLIKVREDQLPQNPYRAKLNFRRRSRSISRRISISRRTSIHRVRSFSLGRKKSKKINTSRNSNGDINKEFRKKGISLLSGMMPKKLVEYVEQAYDQIAGKYIEGTQRQEHCRVVHFSVFREYVLKDPILILAFDFWKKNRSSELQCALIKSLIEKCLTDCNSSRGVECKMPKQKEYFEWLQLIEKVPVLNFFKKRGLHGS